MRREMHFESGLLRVDVTGEFSLEEAERGFLEMLGVVAREALRRNNASIMLSRPRTKELLRLVNVHTGFLCFRRPVSREKAMGE